MLTRSKRRPQSRQSTHSDYVTKRHRLAHVPELKLGNIRGRQQDQRLTALSQAADYQQDYNEAELREDLNYMGEARLLIDESTT